MAADGAADPRLGLALENPALAAGEAIDGTVGGLSFVTLEPARPVPLATLEAAFGQADRLPPRAWLGSRYRVLFPATIPAEGEVGATLLAEIEEDGSVARVTIRRDEL